MFIPGENLSDLQPNECTDLLVTGVGNVLEILFALHRSPEPCREDSVQAKKLNVVRAYCHASGWALSEPRVLQSGVQFRIAPLNAPELSLNIYTSGAHVPKAHEQPDYQTLLTELATLDEPAIPIRRIQKTYTLQDPALRQKLRKSLETLHPQEKRDEQYCEFSFKYERGQERLTVKQFTSGKLQIQGSAGELLKALLECLVPLYKVHYPNASLSVEAELAIGTTPSSAPKAPCRRIAPVQPYLCPTLARMSPGKEIISVPWWSQAFS